MAKTTDRQRGRTWHTAYERIKELILSMEFKPGESVSESRLAQRLGISRTPVREALNKLEQEGLIISSNRRKRVFILTIAETEEIFDLKIAIESGVARWAARRAADPDRRRLAAAMEELTSIGGSRPGGNEEELEKWHRSWLEADAHFHAVLFEMAGNRRAAQIVNTLNAYWHRLKLGIVTIEDRIEKSVGEHQQIADAVISGDDERASSLMAAHLTNLKTMLIGIMKAFHYPV